MQQKSPRNKALKTAGIPPAKISATLTAFEAQVAQQQYRHEMREELDAAKQILDCHLEAQTKVVDECLKAVRIAAYAAAVVSIIEAIGHLLK
jgi:hypothetical protein